MVEYEHVATGELRAKIHLGTAARVISITALDFRLDARRCARWRDDLRVVPRSLGRDRARPSISIVADGDDNYFVNERMAGPFLCKRERVLFIPPARNDQADAGVASAVVHQLSNAPPQLDPAPAVQPKQ